MKAVHCWPVPEVVCLLWQWVETARIVQLYCCTKKIKYHTLVHSHLTFAQCRPIKVDYCFVMIFDIAPYGERLCGVVSCSLTRPNTAPHTHWSCRIIPLSSPLLYFQWPHLKSSTQNIFVQYNNCENCDTNLMGKAAWWPRYHRWNY